MNDYIQYLWQGQYEQDRKHEKSIRVRGWVLGVAVAVAVAAYMSQQYWYPYLSPYLYR